MVDQLVMFNLSSYICMKTDGGHWVVCSHCHFRHCNLTVTVDRKNYGIMVMYLAGLLVVRVRG